MTLRTQLRTHTCGELREEHTGEEVRLAGWVQRVRDHGGMTFVDLRDRYGVVQLVVHAGEDADEGMAELVRKLRNEFVLSAAGVVTPRAPGTENADMPTGKVEVAVKEMTVVNPAPELPFQVEGAAEAGDELRLKHRYLDLRRLRLQRVFALRHRVSTEARRFLDSREFLEIETPMLVKRTPEGARDYLVPSRIQQGQFYALPQSPQLYKQILMCSGFDRYFQLARCLRDEDLRADRQPEHTQIDLEMSFVDEEDIYGLVEGLMAHLWKEALDVEVETPFPRLTHAESMEMYGSDKPDTRCGPAFFEAADLAAESTSDLFRTVAERGERMKGFRVPGGADWSRRILDELAETASGGGAKGLAWMKVDDGGNLTGGISKFFDGVSGALLGRAEARGGDLLLFVAGPEGVVHASLDLVRREVGRRREWTKGKPPAFLWVNRFPLFEREGDGPWSACHHVFTMPHDECVETLDQDPGRATGKLYDLVLDGVELGSGSIRIHRRDLQERALSVIGVGAEEAERRFGFLLRAFDYGAPPHGGIALGLDRILMLMTGCSSLRDVIAFPKTHRATSPMDESPSVVEEHLLRDLGIRVVPSTDSGDSGSA